MIPATEAQKHSREARTRIDTERRNSLLKSIDIMIMDAAGRGETDISVDLGYHDTEYIEQEALKAGYKVTHTHDGLIIWWGEEEIL